MDHVGGLGGERLERHDTVAGGGDWSSEVPGRVVECYAGGLVRFGLTQEFVTRVGLLACGYRTTLGCRQPSTKMDTTRTRSQNRRQQRIESNEH